MEACSAYAVGFVEPGRFIEAVNSVFGRLRDPVLIAEPHGRVLFFAVQHNGGRYTTHAGKHEVDAGQLSRLLGVRVTEINGNSTTDDADVEAFQAGRSVDTERTLLGELSGLHRFGVDLHALFQWGELSIGGGEPSGTHIPLPAEVGPVLVRLIQSVEPKRLDAQVEDLLQADRTWSEIVRSLHGQGLTDAAVNLALEQPTLTLADRTAVFMALYDIGRLRYVEHWANDPDALQASHRLAITDALGLGSDDYGKLLFRADLERLPHYLRDFVIKGDITTPGGPTFVRLAGQGPVYWLLERACRAQVDLHFMRPLNPRLMIELERHGVPELSERAAALRSLAEDFQGPRGIAQLRLLLAHRPEAQAWERRGWVEQLALALADLGDPEAGRWLEQAYHEADPESPARPSLKRAMLALGIEVEEEVDTPTGAGLPEPTPEAKAALATLLASDDTEDRPVRLALARFEAGETSAAAALESVYLDLGYSSPHRPTVEAALQALGML